MKNKVIIRNFISGKLLKKSLTSFSELHIEGKNSLYGKKLLDHIFNELNLHKKYEYIVLIDEDCFILNDDIIDEVIQYMEQNDIDIVGVPDGNVTHVRFHRPDVPNLFFTIFKTKKMDFTSLDVTNYKVPIGETKKGVYAYDDFEPYYQWLCFLIYKLNMKFQPLEAYTLDDGWTTAVKFGGCDFAFHTWFARRYGKDNFHTNRINNIITKVDKLKKKPQK